MLSCLTQFIKAAKHRRRRQGLDKLAPTGIMAINQN